MSIFLRRTWARKSCARICLDSILTTWRIPARWSLPSDVARSGKDVKRAYETVFKAMVNVLERSVAEKNPSRRTKARAIAALCVGGMVAARSLADAALADELRDACMAMAFKLGSWDKPNRKSN